MGYVIVGGICFMVGGFIGILVTALLGANGADTEAGCEE